MHCDEQDKENQERNDRQYQDHRCDAHEDQFLARLTLPFPQRTPEPGPTIARPTAEQRAETGHELMACDADHAVKGDEIAAGRVVSRREEIR